MNGSIEHSKFWLDKKFDGKEFDLSNTVDLIQLASYRRAIANFVLIMSGRDIPVRFAEGGKSLTDGKFVQIGGEVITKGKFDEIVGLCLHEGCHIAQSDFDLVKTLWMKIPKEVYKAANKKLKEDSIREFCSTMFNFVEDAYIDAWAIETAPGYRGYYIALFNEYCNSELITAGLISSAFRLPTLQNYIHRIIFISNPASDLGALPGLRDISDILDLGNILRLKTPKNRLDLALRISIIVLTNIVKEIEKSEEQTQDKSGEKNEESNSPDKVDEAGDNSKKSDDKTDEQKEEPKNSEGGVDESKDEKSEKGKDEIDQKDENDNKGDLSDEEYEEIKKEFEEQSDRVNGERKSSDGLDAETLDKLELLEKSDIDIVPVGGGEIPEINCIVVKNMTKELVNSSQFPLKLMSNQGLLSQSAVDDGIRLGTMLGRKLQVRGESRTTKFVRLNKGKIEKRLISELGFDNSRVFYQTNTDQYKKAHLHVSVDASSSMGSKWKKTITTVVAIAKAASMVPNLSVAVSFRTGVSFNKNEAKQASYIVIAYDSRKDKFSKINHLFPLIYPHGCTPEGLAFEAILDNMEPSTQDLDSYFVNLSDGQPYFEGYMGKKAYEHTKKIVDKIRSNGIEILSYFLSKDGMIDSVNSSESTTCKEAFRTMYGKDSLFIDVDSVTEIARTMNKKFLQRTD